MDMYIAVDIGGTQLRAAVCAKGERHPIKQMRIPTRDGDASPLERLISLIADIWPVGDTVRAIVAAAPGWVNPDLGIIYTAPNIPGWENLPLAQVLTTRFGAPVHLGNDANLAALGEWRFGAGRGHHHLVYLTISTGIGGGVIINDQLLLGARGLAAELGHVTILPDGPMCGCGHRGHVEALGSGTAIAHFVQEQIAAGVPSSLAQLPFFSGRDITTAAENGDALARSALERAGKYVGLMITNYLQIFNPTAVILGGGVSRSGSYFLEPLRAAVAEHVISSEYLQGLVIATAELGDDAGLYGALALAASIYE